MTEVLSYFQLFVDGLGVTLSIAALTLVISLSLALSLAVLRKRAPHWAKKWIDFYPMVLRGLPEFLLILVVFYGSTAALTWLSPEGSTVSPLWAGVFSLSFLYVSYFFEVFRSSLELVSRGEIEAGHAVGLTARQIFFQIEWPHMWRVALPSFGNLWMTLIKDTSLVSLIGLADLMRGAHVTAEATQKPFYAFLVASLIYLAITHFSLQIETFLNKRLNRSRAYGT